jgi:plasmid replication initiation protein
LRGKCDVYGVDMDSSLIEKKKKNLELKKHVGAIHSNNALSLLQRKIANALLYNAYDNLIDKEEHQIHIVELCKLIGYDSKDHQKIKQSLIKLISTVIEWNLVDKEHDQEEGVWNASSIIADASINGPICSYTYSKRMKELLYHPDMYGRLNMKVQAKFKSSYGLALYENCIRYQNITHTPWFEIDVFRKLMGVEEGKYTIFRDFKRRVIDKAVEEVNLHSPITVDVVYRKEGRKCVALQFLITRKQADKVKLAQNNASLDGILTSRYGFSQDEAYAISERYEKGYILEKIALIEASNSFKSGKIAALSRYLEKALESNFQAPKSSKTIILEESEKELESKQWQKRYQSYIDGEIVSIFERICNDNPAASQAIKRDFDAYISNDVVASLYQQEGIGNVLVKDKLIRFVRKYHPHLYEHCDSFEQFLQKQHQMTA